MEQPNAAVPALRGAFYDGCIARAVPVIVTLEADGTLRIVGDDVAQSAAWAACQVTEPLGRLPRTLTLPEGGKVEIEDLEVLSQWERASRRGGAFRLIHALENRKRWVLAALVVLAATVFATYRHGIPWAARHIAARTPHSINQAITTQTQKALELAFFDGESKLPADRRAGLEKAFAVTARAMDPDGGHDYRLRFYDAKEMPNALALPDGLVIVTDELVRRARSDAEVLAVLAHEITHVKERHPLRLALQNGSVFLLWSMLTGDLASLTTVGATLPTVLARSGYSRSFEKEADMGAARHLFSLRSNTKPLRDLLRRIDPERLRHKNDAERAAAGALESLSTHPLTEERIRYLDEFDRQTGAGNGEKR